VNAPTPPFSLAPLFENIPAELRALRQWIVWAHTWKDGEQKFAKVPYSPVTGANASSTDPATWGTFDEAVAAYTMNRVKGDPNDALDGIGFVFTGTPYMGVDQDHVLDDGKLSPEAQRIVEALATYTEVSPSGTGVKSFIKAKKPGAAWSKITGLGLEMYDEGRYFTMTGHVLDGAPREPQDRQAQVDALYYRVLLEKGARPAATLTSTSAATPSMSDAAVVEKIKASTQAAKFARLVAGDITGYPGDSEADMALAAVISFWTQDAEQIERIMRTSKLVRDKWDTRRPGGTYISTTIAKVIDERTEVYTGATSNEKLGLVPLSSIAMKPVPWLWPGYLALGATTLVVGDPNNGKTLAALDLAARLTTGKAWPDGTLNTFGPRSVIVLSAEDANEYTIRPRVEAAGGDSTKVFVIPAEKIDNKLSLESDIARLRSAIDVYKPLLIVIDPLSAYMPGVDDNKNIAVRSSLLVFRAMLETESVTAIGIMHMSKNVERSAMQRVLGSTAFVALARSAYMVARDPDAGEHEQNRRLFLPIKHNLGPEPPGRAFRIVAKTVVGDGGVSIPAPAAEWDSDSVKAEANEVLRQLQRPNDTRRELHDAIVAAVAAGPVLAKEAEAALARFGKAPETLRRHREKVGVVSMRDPADQLNGAYYWLPAKWDPKTKEAWISGRMALRQPPSAA
jgi:AAA domain/NrS-1  polymerase HBD domain